MKWISFYWTLTALLAGAKTVTRRKWKDSYAAKFRKGDLVAAYDRQPRFGGRRVMLLKLTRDPYKENTADMPDSDWVEEGMHVLEGEGRTLDGLVPAEFWLRWKEGEPEDVWVIRFKVVGF